jgi:hypothetical protein
VRLAQKPYPNGGSGWVIANWGIPQPGGTYQWMYSKEREAQELARHSAAKQPVPPPRPKALIDPPPETEAPKAEENEALPEAAMGFISGLDDLGI